MWPQGSGGKEVSKIYYHHTFFSSSSHSLPYLQLLWVAGGFAITGWTATTEVGYMYTRPMHSTYRTEQIVTLYQNTFCTVP